MSARTLEQTIEQALLRRAPGVELWIGRDIMSRRSELSLNLKRDALDRLTAKGWLSDMAEGDPEKVGIILQDTLDELRLRVAEAVGLDELMARERADARARALEDAQSAIVGLSSKRTRVSALDALAAVKALS